MNKHSKAKASIVLTVDQINAAGQLHSMLVQWDCADRCLTQMKDKFPSVTMDDCFAKATGIDRLYGTNLRNRLLRSAQHISNVLTKWGSAAPGKSLVDELARLPETGGERAVNQPSFASKFAHFFICDIIPIMDRYSQRMIAYHLGNGETLAEQNRSYIAFHQEWETLRTRNNLSCSCRALDRYLWIAGQYRAHKIGQRRQESAPLNVELRRLFGQPKMRDLLKTLDGD